MLNQPKSLKAPEYWIGKFTAKDFLIIACLFTLAAIVSFFSFYHLNVFYKLISFIVLSIPIIFVSRYHKKEHCRLYVFIWRKILFLFRKKKYSSSEAIDLYVYKTIDDRGILYSNFNRRRQQKARVLLLSGNSIFKFSSFEQEEKIQQLTKKINDIDFPFSIVKIPETFDFSTNQNKIIKKINQNQNSEFNNYLEQQNETLNTFANNLYEKYFLIIYSNDEKLLEKNCLIIQEKFNEVSFNVNFLTKYQTLLFLNSFFGFEKSHNDLYAKSESEKILNLANIFEYSNFELKENYIKTNNNYYSIQTISDYDYEIEKGWMNRIYNSNSIVVWNISRIDSDLAETLLNKSNRAHGAENLEVKGKFKISKAQREYDIFDQLLEKVVRTKSTYLFDSSILLFNRAKSEKELKELEKINIRNARFEKISLNNLKYRQFKAWNAIQLIPSHLLNTEIQTLAENIAGSWPWNLEILNDNNDFVLATQKNDYSPFIFDIFYRDKTRINSNMMILGTSGSGKSTVTKKILMNQYFNGNKVIVIDPQKEYRKITNFLNGSYIDLKNATNTKINPLQIHLNLYDETKKININSIIDDHTDFVVNWLNVLFPELNNESNLLLFKAIQKIYKKLNYYEAKDVESLLKIQSPILSDLILVLKQWEWDSKQDQELNKDILFRLIEKLEAKFEQNITYKNLFNVQTNIDLSNNFIVFDTKSLNESNDKNAATAQFLLLLKIITNNINTNFYSGSKQKIILCIDEAHMYLKETSSQTREFIVSTAKTIRKFNGSLILTTQNIQDISESAYVIVDVMQYSMFFKSSNKNLEGIRKMYEFSGGLTPEETRFVSTAERGQSLFFVDERKHFEIETHYNEFEKDILFEDLTELQRQINNVMESIDQQIESMNPGKQKDELNNIFEELKKTIEQTSKTNSNMLIILNSLIELKNKIININQDEKIEKHESNEPKKWNGFLNWFKKFHIKHKPKPTKTKIKSKNK